MKRFIWKSIVNICVIYSLSLFLPQVFLQGAFPAILAGALLSLLSVTLRPLLMLLCLPLNLLTLGLFVLVINTWMLQLTDLMVKGFVVSGFWYALLAALFIMLANKLVNVLRYN
ncbi:MAG TPA: phage holin family protein [Syntrophomonas sp.]|nr:phage holin family protein [Syntrophomonas sp.]HRW12125.1 phage holin family protein [Syntrophomonas sp.]